MEAMSSTMQPTLHGNPAPSTSFLVLLSLALVLAVAAAVATHTRRPAAHAPRILPATLPLVGNLLQLAWHAHRFHDWITECCEFFQGAPFAMEMPLRLNPVFIYTPEGVEDVLKTHVATIHKGPHMRATLRDVFGDGIFAADGATWVHQRKTASHLFSTNALRDALSHSMHDATAALLRILQHASDTSEVVDIAALLNRFTIQAFAKMGFGVDLDCLDRESEHPFQQAFDRAQRILTQRFMRPVWFWKLQRSLGVGLEGELKRDVAVIDRTVMEIVSQSLERRQGQSTKSKETRRDIIALFLDHVDASNGDTVEPTYLRDVVVNFLIAGRDTTAHAMTWCLYNLSRRPDVVAKIRGEIARELPCLVNDHHATLPTLDEVHKLVYLEATIKETLRLHPSVPVIPKFAVCDTVLSDGTFLPAGTEITIPTYAMGRMTFLWGDNAKVFYPERWIDQATGKLLNVSAYKFVSFNAGPRMCLGMNLAMLEMKIVLASVLSRFSIELLPSQEITYGRSMTLPVEGPMLARVRAATAPRA